MRTARTRRISTELLVAIHETVMYSPDRRLRITADPRGTVFTVERDLVFVARFSSISLLADWLGEQGIDIADLIVD